jgi:hypothetical protein
MFLVRLIDESRPSVRRECRAHPSWDSVIIGKQDDTEIFVECRHFGLAALVVEAPTMIAHAISGMPAWRNTVVLGLGRLRK